MPAIKIDKKITKHRVRDRSGPLPLSYAQERLWFLEQLGLSGTAYNIPIALQLQGVLEVEALRGAFTEMVVRHESLRTRFEAIDGVPVQLVDTAESFSLEYEDCEEWPAQQRTILLKEQLHREVERRFDLTRGELFRAKLLKLSEQEHVLLLTLHHIVSDGWSMGVFIRELNALYGAYVRGEDSPLAPLPIQYADFALWQRGWLQGEALERQLDYWRERLTGIETLELSTDRPRPLVASFKGAAVSFRCSSELSSQLLQLAQREGATLYMVLLAGWQALLSRLSGQSDVTVGSPIAGRTHRDLEGLIGFFVNTLVLRTDASGDPSFLTLLARVKEVTLGAYAHQDIPFEKLVAELQPERDLSRQPLYQVTFSFQNFPTAPLDLPQLSWRGLDSEQVTAKVDLSLYLRESAEGLVGLIEYATDLFDRSTIERLVSQFERVLTQVLAQSERRVSELQLLGESEREQMLVQWNATAAPYPPEQCIHQLFEEQAQRTPESTAVVYESAPLSYRELDERANQLAHHLRKLGVGPEVVVALCLERSIEMVVALLGVFKAGGAYLPLDPQYPAERLGYMLEDGGASILLTQSSLESRLPAYGGRIIRLDEDEAWTGSKRALVRGVAVSAQNLAYVMYTSGSTGSPKGVQVTHGGLTNLSQAQVDSLGVRSDSRVLQFASLSFDASIFEIIMALRAGAALCLSGGILELSGGLAHLLREQRVSVATLPPSALSLLEGESFPQLQTLVVAGEACAVEVAERWAKRCRFINAYGPTEATVWASFGEYRAGGLGTVPIGRPILNTQLYVLDAQLEPVPVGAAGELYIGGVGLARGYLNRGGLTAHRFIAHPFSDKGERLYRTGDRVRYLADGNLQFLGRVDEQVKIRGYRIELGEIESALLEHEAIEQVAVMCREEGGERRLVGYVTVDEQQLRDASGRSSTKGLSSELITHWQRLYENTYDAGDPAQDEPLFSGWNSSYSGEPIPLEQMQEWLGCTVERIAALKPQRVLEIGCGLGLLLQHLAPACEQYWGSDFSAAACRQLSARLDGRAEFSHVKVLQRAAHESSDLPANYFDTVVLNSVVQYFPDVEYLLEVIEAAVQLVSPRGQVFIGDVRHLWLLEAFHCSVQLSRASAEMNMAELRQRISRAIELDKELVIAPEFFSSLAARLPSVTQVQVQWKRGIADNELSRYRYDVVLHVGSPVEEDIEHSMRWDEQVAVAEQLQGAMLPGGLASARIEKVHNRRVARDLAALRTIAELDDHVTVRRLREQLATTQVRGAEPEEFYLWAKANGFEARVSAGTQQEPGHFDVRLRKAVNACGELAAPEVPHRMQGEAVRALESGRWALRYAKDPLRSRLKQQLPLQLREWLAERVPEYMVPEAIMVLRELPLNANGKINRKALPVPRLGAQFDGQYDPPRTPMEDALTSIWAQILQIERVGIHDDFFALGGHSLMAMRVVAQVREVLQVELSVRALFEAPTVAFLATHIESIRKDKHAIVLPALMPRAEAGAVALSFAQERLWFIEQMGLVASAYNSCTSVKLSGVLDISGLETAFNALYVRHESLRTRFESIDGSPTQVIDSPRPFYLALEDISSLPMAARSQRLEHRLHEESKHRFALADGPMFRVSLLKLDATEHVLLLTLHHIISDGWSMGILTRELNALYAVFVRGEKSPLAPLPIQYADYALWQRAWLRDEMLERQLQYWRGRLADMQTLQLPADKPRPSVATFNGEMLSSWISQHVSAGIIELSRREGVTLYMALLAIFQTLLARWSGQSDIVVGSGIAGRTHRALEGVIGFFINTLVMRTDVSGDPTFRELLLRVKEGTLDAYAHQDIPFEKLVAELQPERDLSRQPLFQVMFDVQNFPDEQLQLDGLSWSVIERDRGQTNFDLTVLFNEIDGRLWSRFEYAKDLFDRSTIERLVAQFEHLSSQVIAQPRVRLSELTLLTDSEREQLLVQWNATAAPFSQDGRIHQQVEERSRRAPDAIAVVYENEEITYADLDKRSNRLAHYLRKLGVGPEVVVGLCIGQGLQRVVSQLAVLKAGGAYLPLDANDSADRLAYMLEDSQVVVLLTEASIESEWPVRGMRVIRVDEDAETIARYPASGVCLDVDPDSLAYVIYTSGSTGRPKGVMISHRSLSNLSDWHRRTYSLDASDRVIQLSNIVFDAAVWELWPALTAGATVVCGDASREVADVASFLKRVRATVAFLVTPIVNHLLGSNLSDLQQTQLRVLLTGGDVLASAPTCALAFEFANHYGPTEATVVATAGLVRDAPTIGRPIANTHIYVLDGHLEPVSVGVTGELYIGGVGLARGYLNRGGLTAQRFVAHPFGVEGERLYRTGDRVRYLADGNLEFLGRVDEQVKIRGYRIELGEIESALLDQAPVRQAVVIAREDVPGEKRLVGYVVPAEPDTPMSEDLHRLPNGMWVSQINYYETRAIYNEIFKDKTYLKHGIQLEDGCCVLDVGANIGLFSLFICNRYPNARVYAFEPVPPIFERLRRNIQMYALPAIVVEAGLSDRERISDVYYYPGLSGNSGLYADAAQEARVTRQFLQNTLEVESGSEIAEEIIEGKFEAQTYTCRLRTISQVLEEHDIRHVDLLKIDVEKSEWDVLMGIEEQDWRKIAQVVVEVHDIDGRVDKTRQLLRLHGFETQVFAEKNLVGTGLYQIYAFRHALTERAAADLNDVDEQPRLIPQTGRVGLPAALRAHLERRLPEYMVPVAVVVLDELPLTASGKVNRQALPAPELNTQLACRYVAPRTPIEEAVAAIWMQLLGVGRVGIHENFFELGGHSLLATRVVAHVRAVLEVELAVRALFETPTVSGLAQHIVSRQRKSRGLTAPPLVSQGRAAPIPLSYAQERLWFIEQLRDTTAYNVPIALQLQGVLEIAALEAALGELIARHESLRTRFDSTAGLPEQAIDSPAAFRLPVEVVSESEPERRAALIRRRMQEEAEHRFDLARDSLFRAILLAVDAQEHVLLLTMHHIVSDGWSMAVLIRELNVSYAARVDGRESGLAPLGVQYADYARWQRNWLQGEVLERQFSYWREKLGEIETLQLPTDRPRPAVASFKGAVAEIHLSVALSRALNEVAQREGATLYMVLLAAWQALLSRLSGQSDIAVGAAIAGRTHRELEDLIGFFVNTLVLRTDVSEDPPFRTLVQRVKEVTLGAYAHQDIPFEKLVADLQPERDLSRQPLFQVMFAWQNFPREKLELPQLSWQVMSTEHVTAKFDLAMHMFEGAAGLTGHLEYATDLFDRETVERLVRQYERVLTQVGARPHQRVSELALLSESEREQLLVEWNATATPYPREQCIHQLFESQAQRTPEAVAVVYEQEQLTYRELNERADQLARHLRKLGVGPEGIVGLWVERSIEMVVGLLGILKAGAAYLPLDLRHPPRRLAFMLRDAGASVLLSQHAQRAALLQLGLPELQVLYLDERWEEVSKESRRALFTDVSPQNLAYMMYTSGSTGVPKAVSVTHRNVVRLVKETNYVEIESSDVFLQISPAAFDASTFEIWGALLNGARLVVYGQKHLDIGKLGEVIGREKVSVLWLTAGLFHQVMDEQAEVLEPVRQLLVGGDVLSAPHVMRALETDGRRLINGYGPTEGTTFSVCHTMRSGDGFAGSVPIGRPIANTQLYVLDAQLEPVPIGVIGELYIGGEGLARGYLNRGGLTAQRFIANPFSEDGGERLYRTGDRVRYLADGKLEFLGRVDEQVKIRGYRVELGEIESALLEQPAVKQAVVLAREDEPGEKRLVGYVVADAGQLKAQSLKLDNRAGEELVDQWEGLYEQTYVPGPVTRPSFVGWNSSYTGEAIEQAQMQEWLQGTADRIGKLGPRKVLEIGCGVGLLVEQLATRCESYWASDFSAAALAQLRGWMQGQPSYSHVQLLHSRADDFKNIPAGKFDTVVLNSVVQYFPDVEYLLEVLRGTVQAIGSTGGRIFIGDVRHLGLLETFHTSVQLHRADENLSVGQLRGRIARAIEQDKELVIDPEFFAQLAKHVPEISQARIELKQGVHDNELTKYRYDVVLEVGQLAEPLLEQRARWLQDTDAYAQLSQLLAPLENHTCQAVCIEGIGNGRIAQDRAALSLIEASEAHRTVGQLREELEGAGVAQATVQDPQQLCAWAQEQGYEVELAWDREPGNCQLQVRHAGSVRYRAAVHTTAAQAPTEAMLAERVNAWGHRYATEPLLRRLKQQWPAQLREALSAKLPEYMLPALLVLDELPLNVNGKIDRKAMPAPQTQALTDQYEAPRTPIEEALAQIWGQVLKVDRVGIHDNFFELGGHSLMAMRVIAQVREILQVELAVRTLFESPNIAELAERVQELQRDRHALVAPPLILQVRPASLPLSYAQERLWFLEQIGLVGTAYNVPSALQLQGELDVPALQRSLGELIARHESLRTRFEQENGVPVQRIDRPAAFELPIEDLSGLPAESIQQRVQERLRAEHVDGFDLARDTPFRASLLKLGAQSHVLLLTLHHIVSDGWSMGVFNRELNALYAAYVRGEDSPLAPLPIQYADFALWQRGWLQGEALERQVRYWREKLAGIETLELPTDRPRPPVASYQGAAIGFRWSSQLSSQLLQLAQREGATLYMVLLAAWQALLSRLSGQSDITVGSMIAGRTHRELEALIGFFVNTLVLRTDVSGDPSFPTLLQRVKEVTLGAYAHQDIPFEKLVAELQPERDLSRQPLFQVSFALQNFPMEPLELPQLRWQRVGSERVTAQFDLSMSMFESGGGLVGQLEYATDLFDRATVERLVGQFERALGQIVAHEQVRVSELDLLRGAEREQILRWNATTAQFPQDLCIHDLFEEQVQRTPDAVALMCDNEQLNYRKLDERANQLAHYLRKLGVGPEVVVGLCLERSVEMVVGLLAILKAGGVYLPLDHTHPSERLAFMVEDAGASIVLVAKASEHAFTAGRVAVCLSDLAAGFQSEPSTSPASHVLPKNLAYLIYTSGSTGRPKGVAATHQATVNRVAAQMHFDPYAERDVCCQKTAIGFVDSIAEVLGPLVCGCRLVIAPEVVGKDAVALSSLVVRTGVTRLVTVPSLAQALVSDTQIQARLQGLRSWTLSGEVISAVLLNRLQESLPYCRFFNLYGSSEVAADATSYQCKNGEIESVPIGRPMMNTSCYVLDAAMQPVPVGVSGELYVGGVGVARGYVGRGGLTAQRFVAHPFSENGERLYRTGDRVRYLASGNLEYIGRLDQQVKIRGYRIEPGEIEGMLLEQSTVSNAIVVAAHKQDAADIELVGYVVPSAGVTLSIAELAAALSRRLPQYMIPTLIVLDALPLNANGKIDRATLPRAQNARPKNAYEPPGTPLEEAVVSIWCEVLGCERVGVHDNFFELGGHSLLMMKVQARVRSVLDMNIPVRAIFDAPDPRRFAARILAEIGDVPEEELTGVLTKNNS